jgi:hypothetical protein
MPGTGSMRLSPGAAPKKPVCHEGAWSHGATHQDRKSIAVDEIPEQDPEFCFSVLIASVSMPLALSPLIHWLTGVDIDRERFADQLSRTVVALSKCHGPLGDECCGALRHSRLQRRVLRGLSQSTAGG